MFSKAVGTAIGYTRPLVVSTRMHNGVVKTDTATYTVINDDGWAITAAHVMDSMVKFQSDQNKIREIAEINAKRPEAAAIKVEPDAITHHSFWWGWDGVMITKAFVNRQMDLAVVHLNGIGDRVREFPVLADPERPRPGTSLCRLGYGFCNISTNFDEASKNFRIPPMKPEELVFPNECMHTRTIDRGTTKEEDFRMVYIETSSPGIGGQSGGPIIDVEGRLHAMQVNTVHHPLGFHPTAEYEGRTVVENQFLNLGVGLSVASIRAVLDSKNVRYDAEGDETGYRITGRIPSSRPRECPTGCRHGVCPCPPRARQEGSIRTMLL